MKNKIPEIGIFVISIISLIITCKLFYNMAIFCDEYNTTPSVICGGNLGLALDWIRLFLLAALSIVSGIRLFFKRK